MTSVMGMAAYVKQELDAYEYQGDDLIAGVTPALVGWTNNPTDPADITDGNPTTFCTTGDKNIDPAWQYAYFEWDLGGFYEVIVGGVGAVAATVGTPYAYAHYYNGSSWISSADALASSTIQVTRTFLGNCSKVRIALTSSAVGTITPNIREFHVWRLK